MPDIKTDVPGLYKSTESGAVLNKDNAALNAYRTRKAKEKKLDSFEKDIISLKNDISEIKELLKGLVK